MFETVLSVILSGILTGAIYAVIASGYSLVYGVTRLINLAHGAFIVLHSYVIYVLYSVGLSLIIIYVITIIESFVMAYLLQRFLINKVVYANPTYNMILFWGISFLIQNLLLYIFTPVEKSISFFSVPPFNLGGITIPGNRLIIFLLSVTTIACLTLFLRVTWIGKAIRAVYQDPIGAELQGINVKGIYSVTLGIGGVLTAISSILLLELYAFSPTVGYMYALYSSFIVILGGLGHLPGTYAAGLILGLLESSITQYLGSRMVYLITFAILYLILLLRPKGIFGKGL